MMKLLATFLTILLNFMWFCGSGDKEPAIPQTEFKVVAYQRTVDAQLRTPHIRWVVEQVPPDSVLGLNNRWYTQYKTFSLADTLVYRPGYHFRAHRNYIYEATEQTPWKTPAEWLATGPLPPGYTAHPEVELTQLIGL